MSVKISVILPSYNGEEYIRESIDSVLDQTFQDWELILVNDCSKDNTLQIMREYEAKDSRIKVIDNKVNQKLPESLNIGFRAATGKYHSWTSDDNMYRPKALQVMHEYLEAHDDTYIVYATSTNFDRRNGTHVLRKPPEPEEITEMYTVGACFLYKKEVFEKTGGYNKKFFLCEDYEFFLNAYSLGFKFGTIMEDLYIYTLNDGSLSSNFRLEADRRLDRLRSYYVLNKLNYSSEKKVKLIFKIFFHPTTPIEYSLLVDAYNADKNYFIKRIPWLFVKLFVPPIIKNFFILSLSLIRDSMPVIFRSGIKLLKLNIKARKKKKKLNY